MSKPANKKNAQKEGGARSAPEKQEIIGEIRKLRKKLGRIPTLKELVKLTGVSRFAIATKFGMYKNALVECGLYKPGNKLSVDELFEDWAAVARKLGKVPSIGEYKRHAKYSRGPLIGHFGGWRHVPAGLLQHGRAQQMEQEWPDVMQLLAWYV